VDLARAHTLGCSGRLEPEVRAWRARWEHGDPAGGANGGGGVQESH
jgi:hypothetical protein